MSIASLSSERDKAKAGLEASPAWIAWTSALTAGQQVHRDFEKDLNSVLSLIDPTPEDVLRLTDGFEQWDAQDPVVNEYKRVQQLQTEKQQVNDLRRHVEESAEWRTLIRLNRELKAQLVEKTKQLRQSFLIDKAVDKVENIPAAPVAEATQAAALKPQPQPAEPPSEKLPEHPLDKPPKRLSEKPLDKQQERPSASPTNGIADHSSVGPLPASRSTSSPTRVPSSFKRDESTKLMIPSWCSGVVPDLYQPVPEHGLGLVDAEVYQEMCGSVRTQVQRIWSHKESGHYLLAAVLRALEFQVDTHYEPPSPSRVDELRDSMLKAVSTWSDEELSACVPEYDSQKKSRGQYFMSAEGDAALLYIHHALHPATAPRMYVIIGNGNPSQLSLWIVGGKEAPKLNTKCIVLFQDVSNESMPHVEVLGWKRGSRGPSPLKTVLDFSETIIQSLESWSLRHDTTSRSTRKRPREEITKPIDLSGTEE